jgi:leader peptidase (prepilin peptidase)/N-methyltransferase
MPEDPFPMELVAAWVVLVGATLGSFLNVVIARLPAGESIVSPRSRCPRCGHPIAWYDNVPIVSWFALRGRCRSCRGRISPRYPLVEAAIAAAAVAALLRHGVGLPALAELVMVGLLVALALIDLDTWLLPHALTWPLIAVGLLASVAGRGLAPGLSSALGAVVGFAAFGAIWLLGEKVFHRELMGLGDAFLLAGIGAWLGLAALLPVVLFASVQGSVVGLAQLVTGRARPGPPATAAPDPGSPPGGESQGDEDTWVPPKHSVPFGPFLTLGALEWLYLAGWVAGWVPALSIFR